MNHGDGNGRGHGHGRSDAFLQFIFVSCFYRCVTSPTKRVCKQPQQLTSRQHASNIMHSQGRATATETEWHTAGVSGTPLNHADANVRGWTLLRAAKYTAEPAF